MIRSSNLHRVRLCPASPAMERTIPGESTPFSEEGTLLHWHDANPDASRDELTDEQRELLDENAGMRMRFMTEQKHRLGIAEVEPKRFVDPYEFVLCDERGEVMTDGDEPITGHPDLVEYYRVQRLVIIWDSKFGFKCVTAPETNLQIQSYAIMAAENLDCDHVIGAISQPRLRRTAVAMFSRADLVAAKAAILADIRAAQLPNAPFRPSADACGYCRGKAYCRAAVDMAAKVGEVNVGNLSIAELEQFGLRLRQAKDVIKAWEARVHYICTAKPGLLKMWGLSNPQTLVDIAEPRAAFQRLVDAGLLTGNAEGSRIFFECVSASRYQLERRLAKIHGVTMKEMKAQLVEVLKGILVSKPKKQSIEEL